MRRLAAVLLLTLLAALALPGWSAPTCSVCGRALAGPATRLSDGRLLCARDAARAVLQPAQARQVFWGAVAAVNAALGPEMKLREEIDAVELVDRDGMRRVVAAGSGQVRGDGTLGLFRLRRVGSHESWTVYLLSGLPPERLATVAAHEYGHAWQAENNPRYAQATRRLREGFAEWVAWSANTHLGRSGELAFMRSQKDADYVQGLAFFRGLERAGGRAAALAAARSKTR